MFLRRIPAEAWALALGITVGVVLELPKLVDEFSSPAPVVNPEPSPTPESTPEPSYQRVFLADAAEGDDKEEGEDQEDDNDDGEEGEDEVPVHEDEVYA